MGLNFMLLWAALEKATLIYYLLSSKLFRPI